jgi:hypothetical protein
VQDTYVPKMSYDDLSSLLDDVDSLYVTGHLSDEEYDAEWCSIVKESGWTQEEFFAELERRWDEPRMGTAEEPRES